MLPMKPSRPVTETSANNPTVALQNQTILIEGIKIGRIGSDLAAPANVEVFDLTGFTVLPGLIGMYDHIYYLQRPNTNAAGSEGPTLLPQMTFSAPRIYLANGVTTIRTAGSVEPYADINLRKLIDAGNLIGLHVEPTAPTSKVQTTSSCRCTPCPARGCNEISQLLGSRWLDQLQSLHAYHPR
jgi:imidazolonepropionase-like amidohydrolase